MILPLVLALVQPTQTPVVSSPDGNPVHIWLDATSPLTRGSAVRVYVQADQDGHLVVLHRRTDGRIEVLFPVNPTDDPVVGPGTYEIRGPRDRAALVVSEPDGTGMILAALAADPVRFDEFAREVAWNPAALVPAWNGADAEGALSDIVQRMLGDGSFNYDFVTYTVAPAPTLFAEQDSTEATAPEDATYPPCPGCSVIGHPVIVVEQGFLCDDLFTPCLEGRRFHRDESRCGSLSFCAERRPPAIALGLGTARSARIRPPGGGGLPPRYAGASPGRPVVAVPMPRARAPKPKTPDHAPRARVRTIPLVPGRQLTRAGDAQHPVAARGGLGPERSGPAAPAGSQLPRQHVRFTLVSSPGGSGSAGGAAGGGRDVFEASGDQHGRPPAAVSRGGVMVPHVTAAPHAAGRSSGDSPRGLAARTEPGVQHAPAGNGAMVGPMHGAAAAGTGAAGVPGVGVGVGVGTRAGSARARGARR